MYTSYIYISDVVFTLRQPCGATSIFDGFILNSNFLLLRSPCNTDKAVFDGLDLVDGVFVTEDVEHAKHLV